MSRRSARIQVFSRLYQFMLNGEDEYLPEDIPDADDLTEEELNYADYVFKGVIDNLDELKDEIAEKAVGYDVSRIFKVDLTLLLMGAYEIKHAADIMSAMNDGCEINKAIVCNEAVTLAKRYSTIKSPSFVNAILAKIN